MIITIGRKCGCCGDEIGHALEQIYHIPFYDRSVISELAKGYGMYDRYPDFYGETPMDTLMYTISQTESENVFYETPKKALSEILDGKNCIILGRAEAYASKNKVIPSLFDGLGMGLGFTFGLTCIGICREILGSGAIFGKAFIPDDYHITFFVLAPGAFLVLAFLTAIQNKLKLPSATNVENDSDIACGGNCASCVGCASVANKGILEAERVAAKAAKAQAAKEAAAKAKAAKEAKAKEAAAAEKSEGKED